ncbi:MAG: RNA polymerase sigma factor [Planctomycetota bacterium]
MPRFPHRPGFRSDPSSADGPGVGARADDLTADELTALAERRPEALERFFDVYFERVYGYVRRLVKDEHAAEDLSQDIFMHLHRALSTYDPRRALRPWVFTIATNKVRDYWSSRTFQDRSQMVGDVDEDGAPIARRERRSEERGPRETLAGIELGQAVADAVERLPEALRQTLLLRYYEELSFEEIARIVDRNEVAVRKRYSRALSELRLLLGEAHELGQVEEGRG